MRPIRLQVVADHRLMAESFAHRLAAESDVLVLPHRRPTSPIADRPHVVVVDVSSVGAGWTEIAEHMATSTAAAVIVLAATDDPGEALAAARAGARAWVPRTSTADDVVEVVRAVADGQVIYPADVLGEVLQGLRDDARRADPRHEDRGPLASLTRREREVLSCLVQGQQSHEIAESLDMAANTVRTHTNRIFRKLGAHSRLEAVRIARTEGLDPWSGGPWSI